MKRIIVISSAILLVLFFGIALSAPQIQDKAAAQSFYEQGYQLYMQAKWNEAITYFDKALAMDSTHLLAWCYKGVALNELERSNEAIASFETALKLDNQCIYALTGKAGVLRKLGRGREDEVITLLAKAVSIQPKTNDAFGYLGHGNAYIHQRNYPQAIADYNIALKINPQFTVAYYNRGNACAAQGKFDQAIVDYNSALKINPQFADAYNGRGNVYAAQGNLDQAIADYNMALKINPQFANAYNNRGNAYAEKKDYKAARRDWEKAVTLDSTGSTGQTARDHLQRLRKMGY